MKFDLMRKKALAEREAREKVYHLPYIALEKYGKFPADKEEQKVQFLKEYLREHKWENRQKFFRRNYGSPGGGYSLFISREENDGGEVLADMGRLASLPLQDFRVDPQTGDVYLIFGDPQDLFRMSGARAMLHLEWEEGRESVLVARREWFDTWEDSEEYLSVHEHGYLRHSELTEIIHSSVEAAWMTPWDDGENNSYYILWSNGLVLTLYREGDGIYTLVKDVLMQEAPALIKKAGAYVVVNSNP